jgi:hypothetical protein
MRRLVMDIGPVQRIVDIEPAMLPLPEVLSGPKIAIELAGSAPDAERTLHPALT